ncbi:MAG: hypothetical protein RLZZ28_1952 [Bacteroidota bacterium]
MLGLVLCGGESRRMGHDKGLIKPDGFTYVWAQTASDKLASLSLPVVISVNRDQYPNYCNFFSLDQLVPDSPHLPLKGPLYGLLSVHEQFPAEDLLVIACDMPLLESFIIKELILLRVKQPEAGAYIFSNKGEPEPLCAIYTAKALATVFPLYQKGQVAKQSMKYLLGQINYLSIPITVEQEKYFQNFNSHASLNGR